MIKLLVHPIPTTFAQHHTPNHGIDISSTTHTYIHLYLQQLACSIESIHSSHLDSEPASDPSIAYHTRLALIQVRDEREYQATSANSSMAESKRRWHFCSLEVALGSLSFPTRCLCLLVSGYHPSYDRDQWLTRIADAMVHVHPQGWGFCSLDSWLLF